MDKASRKAAVLAVALLAACLLAPGCKKAAPLAVRNPDYTAWAPYAPGAYVIYQGVQTTGGAEQAFLLTDKLVAKDADQVILERTTQLTRGEGKGQTRTRRRVEKAQIHPTGHPATHPKAKIEDLGQEDIDVGGVTVRCRARSIEVRTKLEDFVTAEQALKIRAHRSTGIPGGLVKAVVATSSGDLTYELRGRAVQFQGTLDEVPRP